MIRGNYDLGHIIFDMDGTLIDNADYHRKAFDALLGEENVSINDERYKEVNYGTAAEILQRIFPGYSLSTVSMLARRKEAIYRQLYRGHVEARTGTDAFLNRMQNEGIGLHIATMGEARNLQMVLSALNYESFFLHTLTAENVRKGKPDPEIYTTILQMLPCSPENCIAIEDSETGVESAVAAGIRVIGIGPKKNHAKLKAAGCIETVEDFDGLLLS